MYSRGIVVELDVQRHRVRVRFPDRGDLLSPWLEVIVQPYQYGLPAEGAQMACLLDEHSESGCVVGVVYSEADPAPPGSDVHTGFSRHVQIAGGASPLARSDRVDARLAALEEHAAQHTHGTGVGPTTPATQPIEPGESTAAEKITSD